MSQVSKAELEDLAVEIVKRHFQTHPDLRGFNFLDRRRERCGYDIHAAELGRVLRIEIKAHSGEAISVFVTKSEWDASRERNRRAPDDKWELWNIENIAANAGKVRITRYPHLPGHTRTHEAGYWVDLSRCHPEADQ